MVTNTMHAKTLEHCLAHSQLSFNAIIIFIFLHLRAECQKSSPQPPGESGKGKTMMIFYNPPCNLMT